MKKFFKISLLLSGLIITALLFSEIAGYTNWLNTTKNNPKAKNEKTLVVCIAANPSGFDIAQYNAIEDFVPSGPLFNRLVRFDEGTTAVLPSLATHWKVSSDGLTYTFYLRKGVKFHTTDYFKPTRDFNADDVVFTFERMRNPKHPFNIAYPAEFPSFVSAQMGQVIKQILKKEEYSVEFVLNQPQVIFTQKLAKEFASILSAEYANQLLRQGKAAQINQKPVGTGPFVLKKYTKNQKIEYIAHKAYWDNSQDGSVKLNRLIFSIHPDATLHNKKMLAGECHLSVLQNDVKQFKQNAQFITHTQPGVDMWYLAYNTHKPVLGKLAVRQALDMAINKVDLLKPFNGSAVAAVNMMPVAQWPYDKSLKNAPYNPYKAKDLLKAAGYPNGFHLKFFVNLAGNPRNKRVAEMIQADWKKIGVEVEFISYETGEFWRHIDQGDHDIVLCGWNGLDGDPENWFVNLLSCESAQGGMGNHSKWCYQPFDDLLIQARHTFDEQRRAALYIQAQKLFKQQVPFSPLFHTLNVTIYNKAVKFNRSYVIPMINLEQFTGISIE